MCNDARVYQGLFNTFVLKLQQEEYAREGVDWEYVPFTDNDACVALIQGGGGEGVGGAAGERGAE